MVALQRSLDRSVQHTLRLLLLLLGSLIALSVVSMLAGVSYQNTRLTTVYEDRVVPLSDLQQVQHLLAVSVHDALDPAAADALRQGSALQTHWKQVDALWQKYLATYLTPEEALLVSMTSPQLVALRAAVLMPEPPRQLAYRAMLRPLERNLRALLDLQVRVADEELRASQTAGRWLMAWGLVLGGLGVAVVALVIRIIGERIVRPLRITAEAVAALADGRVDAPAGSTELSGDFAEVGDQLRRLRSFAAEREGLLVKEQRLSAALQDAQQELVESEKLASLGALVAGVAHELNTPIGIAVAVATGLDDKRKRFQADLAGGALRRAMLDGFLAAVDDASALIERNLARAAELVRSFKQVAVDRTGMARRRFDLAATVDEILASMRAMYARNGVTLESTLPVGLEIDSYPGALGQALSNLVANGVLHGLDGRPGWVRIELTGQDATAIDLCVSDNGRGMSPEVQAKAFEPFFTTRLGQGGSGLGLPIVRSLVVGVLGGRVSVASEPGKGSRFLLHIPKVAPAGGENGVHAQRVLHAVAAGQA